MTDTFDADPPFDLDDLDRYRKCLGCPTMVPTSVGDGDGRHLSGSAGIYCVACSEDIMAAREEAAADQLAAQRDYAEAMGDRDRYGGMGPS